MKKRIIKGCAWALALLTAVSFLAARQDVAYGATAVDKNAKRSLSFSLARNVGGEGIPEGDLKQDITIRYYKVADMNVPTGTYKGTLKGSWKALEDVKYKVVERADGKGFDVKVDGIDTDYENYSDTPMTANLEDVILDEKGRVNATYAWDALAKMAAVISESEEEYGHVTLKGTADEVVAMDKDGSWDLPLAMYLIMADGIESSNYSYSFKPYLISVPTNGYADGISGDSDAWIYDVEVGLKPEQEERYGRLQITKDLTDFNASLGAETSFIFEVKAEKDSKVVYSDVVQLNFTGAGTQSVTIGPEAGEGVDVIGKIPAGSKVTVTEVYSGSSYTAANGTEQIISEMTAFEEDAGNVATVSFTNQYNGGINGGSSVVNHFAYTEDEDGRGNWKYVESQPAEGGNP